MDSEVSFSTNFKLKIPSTCPKIPSDWLKYELQIMRESVGQIRVFDINKTEIDVQNFAKNYDYDDNLIDIYLDKRFVREDRGLYPLQIWSDLQSTLVVDRIQMYRVGI